MYLINTQYIFLLLNLRQYFDFKVKKIYGKDMERSRCKRNFFCKNEKKINKKARAV